MNFGQILILFKNQAMLDFERVASSLLPHLVEQSGGAYDMEVMELLICLPSLVLQND